MIVTCAACGIAKFGDCSRTPWCIASCSTARRALMGLVGLLAATATFLIHVHRRLKNVTLLLQVAGVVTDHPGHILVLTVAVVPTSGRVALLIGLDKMIGSDIS